jgi:hypothetical protein
VLLWVPVAFAAPQAAFRETRFSAGPVDQGQVVRHAFLFRNSGTSELRVRAVTPT